MLNDKPKNNYFLVCCYNCEKEIYSKQEFPYETVCPRCGTFVNTEDESFVYYDAKFVPTEITTINYRGEDQRLDLVMKEER
ncbi:MAG: hypothetical protein AB1567_04045 [bacterium]